MPDFMPPVGALGSTPFDPAGFGPGQTREQDYAGTFSSVFLQGMLKEIFKNQWKSAIADDNINNSLYSEMLTEEMIKQLAESDVFGLNELIKGSIQQQRGIVAENL
ncbi:MAG: hypothetical protein WC527_02725 [Candidatus Margulisiibacteriota bacterium]